MANGTLLSSIQPVFPILSTKHETGSLRPQNQKSNQTMDGSAPSLKSGLDPTQSIDHATKHTVIDLLPSIDERLPGHLQPSTLIRALFCFLFCYSNMIYFLIVLSSNFLTSSQVMDFYWPTVVYIYLEFFHFLHSGMFR